MGKPDVIATLPVAASAAVTRRKSRVKHDGDLYDWCDEYSAHLDVKRSMIVVQCQMGDGTWSVATVNVEDVAKAARQALRDHHRALRGER